MGNQEIAPDCFEMKRLQLEQIEHLFSEWQNSFIMLQSIEQKLADVSPDYSDKIHTVMESHLESAEKGVAFLHTAKKYFENIQKCIEELQLLIN